MASSYFFPGVVLMGAGALESIPEAIENLQVKKALVITDQVLVDLKVVKKVTDVLEKAGYTFTIFADVKPNPTVKNVQAAYTLLQERDCDFIVSIGGGSPQDTAKGVSILATNKGVITDYNGVNLSKHKGMPVVAVNTTAGTASEATINYVITDEERKVKMVIVDKNSIATVAVNDANLMVDMPKSLTAATGMDALTHAIEGYITAGATLFTDMFNIEAIKVIAKSLKQAVEVGQDVQAREAMAYGQFVTGMGFSNGGLGIVHSMAHQLGGYYDLPHGVCNAILLPHVMEYNMEVAKSKYRAIAEAMGVDVVDMNEDEAAYACIEAVKALSQSVGIPKDFTNMGAKREDISELAELAMVDPCTPGNPKEPTKEDIMVLYEKVI